jgi:hypothetical protein
MGLNEDIIKVRKGLVVVSALLVTATAVLFTAGMYYEALRAFAGSIFVGIITILSLYGEFKFIKRYMLRTALVNKVGGEKKSLKDIISYVDTNYSRRLGATTKENQIGKLEKKWSGSTLEDQSYETVKFICKLIDIS